MNVAVIGGGVAGLSAAWGLVNAGHKVTVFEKDKVGSGASGKALGLLVPFHPYVNGRMAKVQRESIAAWPAMARGLAEAAGVEVGSFFREWGEGKCQLRVPVVLEVMAGAIRAKGGKVLEGTEAHGLDGFDRVIWAAGMGNVGVLPVRADAGQAVRLRPQGVVDGLAQDEGFYVVPDWDGTVLVGSHGFGEMREVPDDAVTNDLVRRAVELVPALDGAGVVDVWVANRPALKPMLPLVRVVDGGVAITGLGKLGFCLAPAVAKAVVV